MKRSLLSNRLKAFTLIELVVAMVISSIVVMVSFTCYRITYKQYLAYRKVSNEISQAFLFNTLFKRDALLAETITRSDDNNLLLKMNDTVNIAYIFNAENALRQVNQSVPDTFPIHGANIVAQFNNTIVADDGLVNDILIKGLVRGEPVCISYYKEYGADVLMQQTALK